MTIKVNTIKRSPTGRESIRSKSYATDDILIGRDASCDLELPALQIDLKHARLKFTDDSGVVLELTGDSRAVVNNRLRSGRVSNLKAGDTLRLGPYRLTIVTSDDEATLVLNLEQVETETSVITAEDEEHIFGLSGVLPSRRLLSWAFVFLLIGAFLILPIWSHNKATPNDPHPVGLQADAAWNTGKMSLLHSNLETECAVCHKAPFEAVTDKTCQECHTDVADHAKPSDLKNAKPEAEGFDAFLNNVSETFGRPVDRCTSCHFEHNGTENIIRTDQNLCASCHVDLDKNVLGTKLANVSDFGNHHPQFSPSVIVTPHPARAVFERMSLNDNPTSFSGLKFPHNLHLDKTGAVAKMAGNLGAGYGFADGVDCADCHRPEAGGALFDPVNMQQDCAMCHSLVFEDDDGYQRTLRHGEPQEVTRSMQDFYEAKALANIRDAEMSTTTRRRPGRAARQRDLNRRELAFKRADNLTAAKVQAIFSEGGACYDCHVIDRPVDPESLDYRVQPITVNDRFYELSTFDHSRHEIEGLTCASCHDAEDSKKSSDVLLPKIEICRDCHIGEEDYTNSRGLSKRGAIPTNCQTCHGYHTPGHASD